MIKRILAVCALAFALAGCGSGTGNNVPDTPPPGSETPEPETPTGPTVASVTLQTSSPQIPSDGATLADITVFVRGDNNQFLADVPVTFSATSGGLNVVRGTTDQTGTALARLGPAGDQSNRTITVSATAGGVTGSIEVQVTGTTLAITGPANMTQGDVLPFTVSLLNAGDDPIPGQQVTLSSANGNTLSATTVTTNANGQATFNVTAANGGNDTITATALGLTATHAITVSTDQFTFATPAAGAEIPLNTPTPVTVTLLQGGAPQPGETITFSTTRGTLSATQAATNGSGQATVSVQASNAGAAVITAVTSTGVSIQRSVEFVATNPASIDLQANPFTIAPEASSTLTAVVRDAQGNLVKNATVVFTLTDVTGGSLSVGSAVTDSQGRAQTVYTASTATSATEGVRVDATVQGTAVTDFVNLTVARRAVSISLGTGNDLEEPNEAQYAMLFAIQVTDASGVGVPNVQLTTELFSRRYAKGAWSVLGAPPEWTQVIADTCDDEDVDHDGVLDAGEDFNSSGRIEAGNVASVQIVNPGPGGTLVTDSSGTALIKVVYPQAYANWVEVSLTARATVQGSEHSRTVVFTLPILADDVEDPAVPPPGVVSPFGVNACNAPD